MLALKYNFLLLCLSRLTLFLLYLIFIVIYMASWSYHRSVGGCDQIEGGNFGGDNPMNVPRRSSVHRLN